MSAVAADNAMAQLRLETDALHRQVEATPAMSRLIRPGLTVDGYADTLARLLALYRPLEQALLIAPRSALLMRLWTRKASLLSDDLASLHVRPSGRHDVPIDGFLGDAEALGALYVIEGATLGGLVIAARVERELGRAAGEVTRFFRCYGQSTKERWRCFGGFVNERLRESEDKDAAVRAAKRVFGEFLAGVA